MEEELKEMIAYGKEFEIEVFPFLELVGYMESILTLSRF